MPINYPNFIKQVQGFTLIELMVSITIVAVLAVVGLTVFMEAQIKARDSRRSEDVTEVAKAIELYYASNRKLPVDASNATITSACSDNSSQWTTLKESLSGYMNHLPTDPRNAISGCKNGATSVTCKYCYSATSSCKSGSSCVGNAEPSIEATLEKCQQSADNEVFGYNNCENGKYIKLIQKVQL